MEQPIIVNYTEDFNRCYDDDAMLVQGRKDAVLILRKLAIPVKRNDGKKAHFELECRFLSIECATDTDQAYACVTSNDYTYWQNKEISKLLKEIKVNDESLNIFEHFNLF